MRYKHVNPYVVRIVLLESGERLPMLMSRDTGLPLFEPTLYALTELRARNRATATIQQVLREADLHLREGFDDLAAPVWFVAAPGAVGKSRLAKEISKRTGAVYLDLARADTVAGNYLTGGLAKNDLYALWCAQQTTVLVDALDEARLRVTQTSFEDFLGDVETLARGRHLPTVLFGRVGIVEEAWLILAERGLLCPIFDIEFFDTARANRFVMVSLERLSRQDGFR